MSLVGLIIFLIIVGVVLYLVRGRIAPELYQIIIVIIVLAVAFWLLAAFGIINLPAALQIHANK